MIELLVYFTIMPIEILQFITFYFLTLKLQTNKWTY